MNGPEFLLFLFHLGIAALTAFIAQSKGRNPVGWFLFGFFFHAIALLISFFVSDLAEIDRKIQRKGARIDRVREELRQERLKNETFRTEAAARLDAHDRVAGVDTRADGRIAAGLEPPALPPRSGPQWYFEFRGEPHGPEPQSALKLRLARAEIEPDTLVWREGLDDWQPASACSELSA